MKNNSVRLTMAQAIVRYLVNQYTEIDGERVPLFGGAFGIFGHGNVTCLAEALEQVQDRMPTWRGQNEQSMALAAVGYTKAKKRRQIMIATSSVGPGATNMVTAAAVAHANRLPLLLLSGDTFYLGYLFLNGTDRFGIVGVDGDGLAGESFDENLKVRHDSLKYFRKFFEVFTCKFFEVFRKFFEVFTCKFFEVFIA